MLKLESGDVDTVLSAPLDSEVFGFHDQDVDPAVLENPFELLELEKARRGSVFLTDGGRIGAIDVGRMYYLDTSRPVFIVLDFDNAQRVLRDGGVFHQGYDTSYLKLMGPVPSALNPPEHTGKRLLINKAFGRMAVDRITTELVTPLADELAERVRRKGSADLVFNYTAILPFVVIAKLMDLPMQLFGQFAQQVRDLMAMGYSPEAGFQAAVDMGALFSEMYEDRIREPKEDLVSHLTQAEIDGQKLTKDDVVAFCRLLTPAGMETTSRTLANLLVALLSDKGQWDLLRDDPDLAANAVEEGLRWEGPALIMPKVATQNVTVGDIDIPKGAYVCVSHGLANRDPSRWDRPNEFDVTREKKNHLAFSVGPHTCVGNQLARKEMIVGLQALISTIPSLKLDPSRELPKIQGVMMRSPAHIYVTS